MSGYGIFSQFYDELTNNVDYGERADYFRTLLMHYGIKKGATCLDVGCGTGMLTVKLSKMGFDMIGIDPSPDMLCEARNNAYDEDVDIMLLCQSAEELDLYDTVDCAVSSLDVINHLDSAEAVQAAFDKIGLFMNPDGVFIFDINTLYKHREILKDNAFVYEEDDVYCVWQNYLNDDDSVDITLDFFEDNGDGTYSRTTEEFTERAYSSKNIEEWLNRANFEVIDIFDDMTFEPLKEDSQRAVIAARYTGKRN
ncbi:MAG: class I SAM-dependent methyltransferase [Clostridia bacterium]|nr:class I SAM-dependent methyltransferase [Clostridia bacterium]